MSFVRFSEHSEVYVFASEHGLECCACCLGVGAPMNARAMRAHLKVHEAAGHRIPDWLDAELEPVTQMAEWVRERIANCAPPHERSDHVAWLLARGMSFDQAAAALSVAEQRRD